MITQQMLYELGFILSFSFGIIMMIFWITETLLQIGRIDVYKVRIKYLGAQNKTIEVSSKPNKGLLLVCFQCAVDINMADPVLLIDAIGNPSAYVEFLGKSPPKSIKNMVLQTFVEYLDGSRTTKTSK